MLAYARTIILFFSANNVNFGHLKAHSFCNKCVVFYHFLSCNFDGWALFFSLCINIFGIQQVKILVFDDNQQYTTPSGGPLSVNHEILCPLKCHYWEWRGKSCENVTATQLSDPLANNYVTGWKFDMKSKLPWCIRGWRLTPVCRRLNHVKLKPCNRKTARVASRIDMKTQHVSHVSSSILFLVEAALVRTGERNDISSGRAVGKSMPLLNLNSPGSIVSRVTWSRSWLHYAMLGRNKSTFM